MRILIISDTHRNNSHFEDVLDEVGTPDMIVHCGDVSGSELFFEKAAPCPIVMVTGNNDFYSPLKASEMFEVDGHTVWVNHGHFYHVHYGSESIMEAASERGADIVLYGHTHVPSVDYDPDLNVYAVNPGSLSLPRQEGHRPSYAIMETDSFGEVHFTINFL